MINYYYRKVKRSNGTAREVKGTFLYCFFFD